MLPSLDSYCESLVVWRTFFWGSASFGKAGQFGAKKY